MTDTTVDEMIGVAVTTQMAGIPDGLDEMEPGPFLAIVLSGIDPATLPGEDRVIFLRASQRLTSHYQAVTYVAAASVVDAYQEEMDLRSHHAADAAAYELRCALHLTRRAADNELALSLDLRDRLPRVLEALSVGLIDQRRARTIVWQTTHLTDEEARSVVDQIIEQAPRLTTGQLTARLTKLCAEVGPDQAEQRYEHAVENRRVVIDPTPFGTANLYAFDLPPDKATAAARRLDRIARSLRHDGESRTMDQLRADALLDLLCGSRSNGVGSTVEIRVELDTLTELKDRSGDLAGYGPVIADIARKIVDTNHDATWRYTVTDNGRPVATGTTRRRPSTAQRRVVEMTHPTCIFPGCRTASTDCDIDHRIEWERSKRTVTDDLAPLCPHDHGGKHTFGWTYRILPNGDIEWTSPLGRVYTVRGRSP